MASFLSGGVFPASIIGETPIVVETAGVSYRLKIDAAAMTAAGNALGLVIVGDGLAIASNGALSIAQDILDRLTALEESAALAATE